MIIETRILENEIHTGIKQLTANPEQENEKDIGYLVAPTRPSEKLSVVTPEGETLGDFCCEACATKAAFLHAYGLTASEPEMPNTGVRLPAALMLMALLAASARH